MDLIDLLLQRKKENEKYFKNPQEYAFLIKKRAKEILGEVKVYLFGSVIKGNWTPDSDIDVLVVSDNFDDQKGGEIKAKLLEAVGFFSPFEIHLVTKKVFENWYKKFIKEGEILEIK